LLIVFQVQILHINSWIR